MALLTIDFFHDVVCCWSFNISSRLRMLAVELDLDIRHRTFVLQGSEREMAERWGTPEQARDTILGHWERCRGVSDRPELVNIKAMRKAPFPYPHGNVAARACKAAEALGGQAAHWDMFDSLQRAHLSEARDIADRDVVVEIGAAAGFDRDTFTLLVDAPETKAAVDADRLYARQLQVTSVPSLIVRQTGNRLVNGPTDDLRAQITASARLATFNERAITCAS
ncbi:DsbA family oxidoreductase [Amaricoccus tamworthensis]|uniref:DsbA family oxidoreductase n=1 Tax=Amaricoccus tamworthensis TaxID=57002 RepID=UPI003C7EA5C5